ncbi:hypothetical protein MRB53_007414 [Persea americana]|uniref:Uncharacterized protein n=1 Tax=Persea americana TaxID=3435 RepID=A0ACC2MJU1_PERAE|nr:hypothetical protein MRB53_007414 [Persea americana]
MSGLVDKWTGELAKQQEKDRALVAGGSSPSVEPSTSVEPEKLPLSSSSLAFRAKPWPTVLIYSESTLSMFMECFSP